MQDASPSPPLLLPHARGPTSSSPEEEDGDAPCPGSPGHVSQCFVPAQVGAAVRQRLAALAAAGAGAGRAPGTFLPAQLLGMDSSAGTAPPAARSLVSGASALPKPSVHLGWRRGSCVTWRPSISPALWSPLKGGGLGTPLLAKLLSSETISLVESKRSLC